MAFQEQFGEDDWQIVVRAPFQAALAIIAADPGGLVAAGCGLWKPPAVVDSG